MTIKRRTAKRRTAKRRQNGGGAQSQHEKEEEKSRATLSCEDKLQEDIDIFNANTKDLKQYTEHIVPLIQTVIKEIGEISIKNEKVWNNTEALQISPSAQNDYKKWLSQMETFYKKYEDTINTLSENNNNIKSVLESYLQHMNNGIQLESGNISQQGGDHHNVMMKNKMIAKFKNNHNKFENVITEENTIINDLIEKVAKSNNNWSKNKKQKNCEKVSQIKEQLFNAYKDYISKQISFYGEIKDTLYKFKEHLTNSHTRGVNTHAKVTDILTLKKEEERKKAKMQQQQQEQKARENMAKMQQQQEQKARENMAKIEQQQQQQRQKRQQWSQQTQQWAREAEVKRAKEDAIMADLLKDSQQLKQLGEELQDRGKMDWRGRIGKLLW